MPDAPADQDITVCSKRVPSPARSLTQDEARRDDEPTSIVYATRSARGLALRGVPLATAMKLMRHSGPVLTSKVYTVAGQLPTRDAVLSLPSLAPHASESAPQCAPEIVPARPGLSEAVTKTAKAGAPEAAQPQDGRHDMSNPVTQSRDSHYDARYIVRTRDFLRVKFKNRF